MIGLSLLGGGGVSTAVIAAVFISNVPESIAATAGLAASGWRPRRIMLLWAGVGLVCALAAPAGYGLFDDAAGRTVAFVQAFAGGAGKHDPGRRRRGAQSSVLIANDTAKPSVVASPRAGRRGRRPRASWCRPAW